ncbi:MAG: DUF2147 domain-containing protein [Hyphomicrobiaceae bacterium]|nr:DUF2147 domain-containing protein [Hyphomicrobiaceae bacterium]
MEFDRLARRDANATEPRRPCERRFTIRAAALLVLMSAACTGAEAQTAAPKRSAPQPPSPVGVWYDDTGNGAVEIAPCGARLCGRIFWLKDPVTKGGQVVTDALNPDPLQRQRPVCGLQVIGDLEVQTNGAWDKGWIYDPKEGKSYDVEIRLRAPDRLQVKGYLGVKFLSESFIWQRAPAELPRCAAAN